MLSLSMLSYTILYYTILVVSILYYTILVVSILYYTILEVSIPVSGSMQCAFSLMPVSWYTNRIIIG